MSDLIEAVDVSKYAGHIPAHHWSAARIHHGVRLAVVGAWHGTDKNPHAAEALHDARMAGLTTAAYIVLNSRPGRQSVILGEQACGDEWAHLSFVALDIEVDGVTVDVIADAEAELGRERQRPMLYTGYWFWASPKHGLDNATDFAHLPLWDSRYDHVRTLEWGPHKPFGGWAQRTAKQYEADSSSLGFSCDRSVFAPDWLRTAP